MSNKVMDTQYEFDFHMPDNHYNTILRRRNPHAQNDDVIKLLGGIISGYEENLRSSGTLAKLAPEITDQLFGMINSMPVSDRVLISMSLANFGNPLSTALFVNSLNHENCIVRYISAESLAIIGDPDSIDQIFTLYNDESEPVRLAAEKALIKML